MRLAKIRLTSGGTAVGVVEGEKIRVLEFGNDDGPQSLSDLLHAPEPLALIEKLVRNSPGALLFDESTVLAPIDRQEVWAAGVTYQRSKVAREEESEGAARFYDLVYSADRPELFLKAPAERVVGPGDTVRIRRDSQWNVPEPELALVVSPDLRIVGYTIGNDMSSRDIEGENPLYLPQAKVYDRSCSLGPIVTLADEFPPLAEVEIRLVIKRDGQTAFEGSTHLSAMKRTPEELVSWLGREISFPHGAVLMTGTGIVPPDDFSLQSGDDISISVTGIGTLRNTVE